MSRRDEEYLELLKGRYRKASRKERSAILDEFVKTTDYHRKHAIVLLNGRRQRLQGPIRRPRRAIYGTEEARALLILSQLFDHINSKRLRKALDAELQGLYELGFLQVSSECYQKLRRVSPATMDRLLAGRRRRPGKRRGFTKPGTLLKHQSRSAPGRTGPRIVPDSAKWIWSIIAVGGSSAVLTMLGHYTSQM